MSLRVVCPFIDGRLEEETLAALRAEGMGEAVHRLEERDDAYWELLLALWTCGDDFVLVEQDIVIWEGAVELLATCPSGWCALPYELYVAHQPRLHYGLGCTKFSAAFCQQYPLAIERIGIEGNEMHPPKHWCNLDDRLATYLRGMGAQLCTHWPEVDHVHPVPSHGCSR
jgi:hypothetical protein